MIAVFRDGIENRSEKLRNIVGAACLAVRPCYDGGNQAGSTVEEWRPRANLLERGHPMGKKVDEALDIAYDDMPTYLHANHSMYMETPAGLYYLTDVNDRYWRVQDAERYNEKGHYVDCSPLVPTIAEFLELPFDEGGTTIKSIFEQATFYPSGSGKDIAEATGDAGEK